MKNIICMCNTYFQLITAIQLKLTIFDKDNVSLIISDYSNDSYNICRNVRNVGLFENCYHIEIKDKNSKKKTVKEKISQCLNMINGKDKLWEGYLTGKFDEIIYYSQLDEIYTLYAKLSKINPDIKVSRYEEGIFSYEGGVWSCFKVKVVDFIRHLFGKPVLKNEYLNFYCFYPELYIGKFNCIKIPTIHKNDKIQKILRQIFVLSEDINRAYNYKYIYFSSVYDFEGGQSIHELELVRKISNLVGNNNLLVKVHPRDDIQRFKKAGLNVDANSNIPWEVIQLSGDFSEKVFLTVNSSSALSGSLLADNSLKIYYMYLLCDTAENKNAEKSVNVISRLISSDFVKKRGLEIKVVQDIQEIL
ncbi:MAG: hypothetical protein V8S39_13340 [Lachnospiraceae bacterium]